MKELGFANHTVWDLVETPQPIQSQIISKSQSALRPVLSELGFNAPFGTSQSGRVYERQRRIQYVDKNARTRSRAHSSFPTQFIFSLDGINFQQLSKIDRCVKDCAYLLLYLLNLHNQVYQSDQEKILYPMTLFLFGSGEFPKNLVLPKTQVKNAYKNLLTGFKFTR